MLPYNFGVNLKRSRVEDQKFPKKTLISHPNQNYNYLPPHRIGVSTIKYPILLFLVYAQFEKVNFVV